MTVASSNMKQTDENKLEGTEQILLYDIADFWFAKWWELQKVCPDVTGKCHYALSSFIVFKVSFTISFQLICKQMTGAFGCNPW